MLRDASGPSAKVLTWIGENWRMRITPLGSDDVAGQGVMLRQRSRFRQNLLPFMAQDATASVGIGRPIRGFSSSRKGYSLKNLPSRSAVPIFLPQIHWGIPPRIKAVHLEQNV